MMNKRRSIRYLVIAFAVLANTLSTSIPAAASAQNNSTTQQPDTSQDPPAAPEVPESMNWPVQSNEIPDWPQGPQVLAETAIVMEASSGAVLYAKNIDETRYPASITKIMTTLVALEHSTMDEQVTFSENAIWGIERDSTHIGIKIGETLTMEQSLYGIMLASANEVAYAVAEHIGGSMEGFAEMMNEKARSLGCTNTNFVNSNGLHNDNHYTTAHDMALISQAALQNESFRSIIKAPYYVIPPTNLTAEERWLDNHHKMVRNTKYQYEGCIGGKTGYTTMAGNTLVTYADKNGVELICVVLKSKGTNVYSDTSCLLDYGFNNFKKEVLGNAEVMTSQNLLAFDRQFSLGSEKYKVAIVKQDTCAMLPNDASQDTLQKKEILTKCRKKTEYYYHNQMVGIKDMIIPKVLPNPPLLKVSIDTIAETSGPSIFKGLTAFKELPGWKYPMMGLLVLAVLFYVISFMIRIKKRSRKSKRKKH